jgi:hypothetical protein
MIGANDHGKALVLIPCGKRKRVLPVRSGTAAPVSGILSHRESLLGLLKNTPDLANRSENRRGVLNDNAPISYALDLYTGQFFHAAGPVLRNITTSSATDIHVLVVSALYGLTKLDEGLREYDLTMGDTLSDGTQVYQFWQVAELSSVLERYMRQQEISTIWSLLPDSLPDTPYHRVFDGLWSRLRRSSVSCFHVKALGAGTGTGSKRGAWLRAMLCSEAHCLRGSTLPPKTVKAIPGQAFEYQKC